VRLEHHAALVFAALTSIVGAASTGEPARIPFDPRVRIEAPRLFDSVPAAAMAAPLAPAFRGGCERSGADLCFDAAERRLVYRRARQYMPGIAGMTPEGISLRRDGIRFRYSFP
jgi:hypothetical protein